MSLFLLKLLVTPLLIALVTWVARVHGPRLGGALAGLPLTSGPISYFLATEHGPSFAARAALGALEGTLGVVAFCAAYRVAARRGAWPLALGAGLLSFAAVVVALGSRALSLPVLSGFASGAVVLLVVPRSLVRGGSSRDEDCASVGRDRSDRDRRDARGGEAWILETLVRMAVATTLVGSLTVAAHLLGPSWSGVLSALPIITAILAVSVHARDGDRAAASLLAGVALGSAGTLAFFVCVAALLRWAPAPLVYAFGATIALAANAVLGRAAASREVQPPARVRTTTTSTQATRAAIASAILRRIAVVVARRRATSSNASATTATSAVAMGAIR